jgi:hypothetical protein
LVYKMGDKKMEKDKVYCSNCDFELLNDEEFETGLCDLCYEDLQKEEMEERRHPDDFVPRIA